MSSSELPTAKDTAAQSKGEASVKSALRRPARAELIWDGKYDAQGKRVAPLRVALPFQTVETVNESAQDRQRACFRLAFAKRSGATGSSGATRSTSCRRCCRNSPAR